MKTKLRKANSRSILDHMNYHKFVINKTINACTIFPVLIHTNQSQHANHIFASSPGMKRDWCFEVFTRKLVEKLDYISKIYLKIDP